MNSLIWLVCAVLFYGVVTPLRCVWRAVYNVVYCAMLAGGAYIVYCAASGFSAGYFGP